MKADGLRNALIGAMVALIAVLLVASGFLVRVVTEPESTTVVSPSAQPTTTASSSSGSSAADDLGDLLDDILDVLEEDFVEPERIDRQYLSEGAINGLFEALADPHSTYIDPDTYAISRDDFSGAFEGIGATVSQQDRHVVIVRPLPDTPAERAGVLAGDIILEVDGEDAEGWSVQEAVLKIRGPRGTTVEIKVRHADGTEEVIAIVRDEVEVASVTVDPPGGALRDSAGELVTDLGYVRIRSFTRTSPDEVEEAIRTAIENGAGGLIIDVRSNPGGLLTETTQIADMFLDDGIILTQRDRAGNERVARATSGVLTDLPVVILQDEFSASGSELLAAALQENGRATVIGQPSFGKGTVNHVRELDNGGAVYVSIARWFTPAGNIIEGRGVLPDIEVEVTIEDIEANRDVAILRAIDVLHDAMGTSTVSADS